MTSRLRKNLIASITLIVFCIPASFSFSSPVQYDNQYTEIVLDLERTHERFPVGEVFSWKDKHDQNISGVIYNIWNTRAQRGSDSLQLFFDTIPSQKLKIEDLGRPLPDSGTMLSRINGMLVALPIINETEKNIAIYSPSNSSWKKYSPDEQRTLLSKKFVGLKDKDTSNCGLLTSLHESAVFYKSCAYTPELGLITATANSIPLATDGLGVIRYVYSGIQDPSGIDYCLNEKCHHAHFMHRGAFPYLITRTNDGLVIGSNYGGVQFYNYKTDRVDRLRKSDEHSYQLYTSIYDGKNTLIGQYPDGRLLTLDGKKQITDNPQQLPLDKDILATAPEVQSLAAYDGRLFAGVWPFGELYVGSYNGDWTLFKRFFSAPQKSNLSPFTTEISGQNELGQRIYDMITIGDSLYVVTSSKTALPLDKNLYPIEPRILEEYGHVYKISGGRTYDVPLTPLYTTGHQTIRLRIYNNRIECRMIPAPTACRITVMMFAARHKVLFRAALQA